MLSLVYRESTENIVKTIIQTLQPECIELYVYKQTNTDLGDVVKELVDSCAIVVGTFYVLGSMHPDTIDASDLVKVVNSPTKFCAKDIKNKGRIK